MKEFPAHLGDPDAAANDCTQRGLALLQLNTTACLQESISWFDQAIALRQALPLEADPWLRYGLIAGWLNRADALTRLGSPAQLAQALESYAAAFAHLQLLPIEAHPLFKRRLIVAWLNRAATLQAQATERSFSEAIHCFDQAIQLLGPCPDTLDDCHHLLGGAWLNRATALLSFPQAQPAAALASARHALRSVEFKEREDVLAAEISLKARHVLCRAAARALAVPGMLPQDRDQLLHESTDAVDEGIDLIHHWEQYHVTQFRPLAPELFRFGALAYQLYQPHFLGDFILDGLDRLESFAPCEPARRAAREVLDHAFGTIQREAFEALHKPQFHQVLQKLDALRKAEARLQSSRAH
ncbi:MAG: hypothetical protein U1G07_07190 [Verrucomicrobiota bacterium]